MMTKKHFQKFADAIALVEDYQDRIKIRDLIIGVLASDNPRFDASRFDEWIRRIRNNDDKGIEIK